MSESLLSSRTLAFQLDEVLGAEALTRRFAEHNRQTFDAAIGTAQTIAGYGFRPPGKQRAARYLLTWVAPGCHHEMAIMEARDATCPSMQGNWF